jgi:hypothetical protein
MHSPASKRRLPPRQLTCWRPALPGASRRGPALVVEAAVAPGADVEVGAQQAVGVAQHVQVEGGRHAQRVVVGGVQHRVLLGQVDADQDAAVRPALGAHAAQEGQRLVRREIADRGTGIEEQAALLRTTSGRRQSPPEKSMPRAFISMWRKRWRRRSTASCRKSAEMSTGTYWADAAAGTGAPPWRSCRRRGRSGSSRCRPRARSRRRGARRSPASVRVG